MANIQEFSEQSKSGSEKVDTNHLLSDFMHAQPLFSKPQENQMDSIKYVEKGTLPRLDLFSAPELRTGRQMSPKELENEGIKSRESRSDDGTKETKVDFPNGVRVTVSEGKTVVRNGREVEIGPGSMVEVSGADGQIRESSPGSGVLVDKSGKQIAKHNEDGSVTVDSGDGVYTTHPDGTIRKEVILRSRDGKSWEILDANAPLGKLRNERPHQH